jgi:hypothetical protein
MNNLDNVGLFNLLNEDGKKLAIHNIRSLLDIVISIMFFGNPTQSYFKGLLDVAVGLVECMCLEDNKLFPTVRRDPTFLAVLDKFNKLQKNEEVVARERINRIIGVEPPSPELPCSINTMLTK